MVKQDSKKVLYKWCENINSGKMEKLLELYDDNAIIIPTFSQTIITTNEMRKSYFSRLFNLRQLSVTLHKEPPFVQKVTESIEIISGFYTFQYLTDEKHTAFDARYSFVINKEREKPILHHHSSLMPEVL